MLKSFARSLWIPFLMGMVWMIFGIAWYQEKYFIVFTVIELIAGWNVYAFLNGRWMFGYDLLSSQGPGDDTVIRGFLFFLYIFMYFLFICIYVTD